MTSIARKSINADKHVIICGYGRCGQNLARMLEREGIPYMALDLDPDRVRQAAAAGRRVVFGDAARLQALMAAGLARASAVVVTYLGRRRGAEGAGQRARARAAGAGDRAHHDDPDLEKLQAAGATEVVPEAIEGSLMLASHALALVGVPMRRVIRDGAGPARRALQPAARLLPRRRRRHRRRTATRSACSASRCRPRRAASARRSATWRCTRSGVRVVSARAGGRQVRPADDELSAGGRRHAGAVGQPEALALAEEKLLAGR